jgi:hypothetical protein
VPLGSGKSFVLFMVYQEGKVALHYDRRKAVESAFRGLPPPFRNAADSVKTLGNRYKRPPVAEFTSPCSQMCVSCFSGKSLTVTGD